MIRTRSGSGKPDVIQAVIDVNLSRRSSTQRLRLLCLGIFGTLAVCLFPCASVQAANVGVVLSAEIEPYRVALRIIRETSKAPLTVITPEYLDNPTRLRSELDRRDISVVLSIGPQGALAVQRAIPRIPIVFCMVRNPHRHGLTGNQMAGVSLTVSPLSQFVAAERIIPKIKTIGVLYDPSKSRWVVDEGKQAAQRRGLELIVEEVSDPSQVPKAFKDMLSRIDLYWLVSDTTVLSEASYQFMLIESLKQGVPMLATSKPFVKTGALFAVTSSYENNAREAVAIVNRLIAGERPSSVGVVRASTPEIVINLRTARRLNIQLEPSVIENAQEVYR